MGLFVRRQARHIASRSEIDAEKAKFARAIEESMWSDEDRRESERMNALPRRSIVEVNTGVPGFPFAPGSYVGAQDHIDDNVAELHGIWYANATALVSIIETVDSLVRMLNVMTPMTRIKVDMSNIRPVDDITSNLPEHYAWAYLNQLTPTGRTPKYTASVEFIAGLERPKHMTIEELDSFIKEHPSPEQSSGKIDYLPDGRVGKARLGIWDKPYFYVAHFKLVAGELVVSRYSRDLEGKTEVIYRLD